MPWKKNMKSRNIGVISLLCVLFLGSSYQKQAEDTSRLDDIFNAGRGVFFSELRLKFGLHPSRFNLRHESIKKIQNAEKEIPFLYENLANIIYLKESPHFEALLKKGDIESIKKFHEKYLKLCHDAADHFVQSLFQEKSNIKGNIRKTDITEKNRLDLILKSISDEDLLNKAKKTDYFVELDSLDFYNKWGFQITRFKEAHKSTKGKGISIAIIDSGIDKRNKILKNANINDDFSFCLINRKQAPWEEEKISVLDEYGHGTAAATLVAAAAPEAELQIYKIRFDRHPIFPYWTAYQAAGAIYKAVFNHADVILVSSIFDKNFKFLKDACQYAYDKNVIIICPNGLTSQINPGKSHQFPAHYNTTIAVAGVIPNKNKIPVLLKESVASHFTSLSAPAALGDADMTPENSWAAAITAGLVTLVSSKISKSENELKGQYYQRIYEILTKSAQPQVLGYKSFNTRIGYGLINAELSVNEELVTYVEKMKKIEENFQNRLKEIERREEKEKEKKKKSKKENEE